MTELQVKTKKGSLKKFFAMFLAVCVCMTTINVSAGLVEDKKDDEPEITLGATTMDLEVNGAAKTLTVDAKQTSTWTEWIVSGNEAAEVTKQDGEYVPVATADEGKEVVSKANSSKTDVEYSYTTSGSGKVTLTKVANGLSVKGTAAGDVTITVKAGNTTKTCTVKVKATDQTIHANKVTIKPATLVLQLGKTTTGQLTATVEPAGAVEKVTKWESSNNKVATVDANGKVTAVAAGTATIKATTSNNIVSNTCTVTVKAAEKEDNKPTVKPVKVKKVTLSASKLYLVAKKSVTVGVGIEPSDAKNKAVTWKSKNTKVATVKNGKITAKNAAGKNTTITATAKDGSKKSASVKVYVVKKATKITKVTLPKTAKVDVKGTVALKTTIKPAKATLDSKTLKWSTSDKKVATVANGVVTGKKAGVATITVKAGKKSAKCVVTVTKKGVKATLQKTKGNVKVKKTLQIKLKGKGDSIVDCKTSNKKVATVSKKGKITGKKKGTATITVITKKGGVATFKVTVKK